MSFIDEYLPGKIPGMPFYASPRFKTSIQVTHGGNERRNQEWQHPLHTFTMPEAVAREWIRVEELLKHWLIMCGPFNSFPLRNPLDFASCDLTRPNQAPTPSMTDQMVGSTDGFTDTFQLVKTYSIGGETYDRTIHLPVVSSVIVAIDGVLVDDDDYTVSRPGGEITFNTPPVAGDIVTAGFLFDNEVRYESDDAFDGILRSTRQAGFADLTLVEVRPC